MRLEEIAAKALEKVDSDRYVLSLVVAKRAKELSDGAQPLVPADTSKQKFTDIALAEVAAGKVSFEGFKE